MAGLRYNDEQVEEVTNNGGHLDLCMRLGDCRELDNVHVDVKWAPVGLYAACASPRSPHVLGVSASYMTRQ